MKKIIFCCLLVFFSVSSSLLSQNKYNVYSLAFYNVENLFDTVDDENVNDEEFTPSGSKAWTPDKYNKKLSNIGSVISQLGKEYCPEGPVAIGLVEIENRGVLEDLLKTKELASRNYEIVHYDSPDKRGVDVALLYNPSVFKVTSSKVYPYNLPDKPYFKTRDQLLVSGTIAGEPVHVIVNHWPSRYGGNKSSYLREFAASITKHIADSIYQADPSAKIVIMGDMNDDPVDVSTRVVLDAKRHKKDVEPGGLYNTMWGFYDKGIGSLVYQNKWNLFDQIIISESLLGDDKSTLTFWKPEIFNKDFLIQKSGRNKGYPLRTFSGNTFLNGYSDHFPTLIYLVKQIQ